MYRVIIKNRRTGEERASFRAPSIEVASAEYSRLRDASGEGGSTWPTGVIYPAEGEAVDSPVGFISYNGKVWSTAPEEWDWRNPRVGLLFDPSEAEAAR